MHYWTLWATWIFNALRKEKAWYKVSQNNFRKCCLLKYVHYVPQPPFKILGALQSKVGNALVWISFCGLQEGVLKVATWFILDVHTRVYPVMVLSPFGTGGQGLGLTGVVNVQITAVKMDWRECSYSPSELPLSRLFWEIKMVFSVYCMMQVSSLVSTDPSTICCQDTSWWQEWDKKPASVTCISVSLVIPISLSVVCKVSQGI